MMLEQARAVAEALVVELRPCCHQITVAGSIRRGCSIVQDIDLVLIPANQGQLAVKLHELGCRFGGAHLKRFHYRGIPVDLYLATEDTYPMLLLVRTGSTAHNQWLATRAKRMGLHFAASGQGILRDGNRVAWRSEEEVFGALGLPYIEPERRERL